MENENQQDARAIWAELSADELALLGLIAANKFKDNEDEPEWNGIKGNEYTTLWDKRLIARRYERTYATDLGRQVLSQAASDGRD